MSPYRDSALSPIASRASRPHRWIHRDVAAVIALGFVISVLAFDGAVMVLFVEKVPQVLLVTTPVLVAFTFGLRFFPALPTGLVRAFARIFAGGVRRGLRATVRRRRSLRDEGPVWLRYKHEFSHPWRGGR